MDLVKIDKTALKDGSEVKRVLGENLKRLRESKGLTRKEFGTQFGISPLTVRNAEQGVISPKIPALIRYADFYNVSLDELFGRKNFTDEIIFNYRLERATEIAKQVADVSNFNDDVIISETPEYSVVDAPRRTLAFSNEQMIKFIDLLMQDALNEKKTFREILNDKLKTIFSK